ncbi:hypothetical protein [Baaleninema simplex]|uniref:hypothetical protein n=1 Tax=Baaleninema simplex TaxID=2862350 RepID=UPI000348438B|nr:hypothetical protein [Baaleninema simplex]
MALNKRDLDEIQKKLAPFLSKQEKLWQPWQGIGSFLTFNFGKKLPPEPIKSTRLKRIRKTPLPDRGEWGLWIYMCGWRIEQGDRVLAGSNDDRSQIAFALQKLEGQIMTSVEISYPFGETIFIFDNEIILRTFPINYNECDDWMFFMPNGYVLSLGSNSSWSYHKSSEPKNSTKTTEL